jgi:N-acetyl-anhydromuramyl-L-alanine amidase AmpD
MIGYPVQITGVYDEITTSIISAVQRRYRPDTITGHADAATLAVLKGLAQSSR